MPRSLKIAMITPQWQGTMGGPSKTVEHLIDHLRRNGHIVWVLTSDEGDGALKIKGGFLKRHWGALASLINLHPNIVHIHGRISYILPAAIYRTCFCRSARIVFTFYTQPYLQDFLPPPDGMQRGAKDYTGMRGFLAKVFLKWCDHIVTVSESIIENLNKYCGFDVKRFTRIPSGTELPLPCDESEAIEKFKVDHELQSCYPVLSTAGVLAWDWKVAGAEISIRAIQILKSKYTMLRLLIIGDGPYLNYLRQLIEGLDLTHEVLLLGNLVNLVPVFRSSDLYLQMSLNEGCSLAIAEAMAARKCVIGSRRGGIPESIQDNETGVVIEPNPSELAETIQALLADEPRRNALAANAYDHACRKLSWSVIAREYESLYSESAN